LLVAGLAHAAPGGLDESFGQSGSVVTDFGEDEYALATAVQQDGKILVVGESGTPVCCDFVVARYQEDGTLDGDFGSGGVVLTDLGGNDTARAVAVQDDGGIVVVGNSDDSFALARYNPDGTLDAGFGDGGTVVGNPGGLDFGEGVAIQPDGKIVATGYSAVSGEFGVARFDTDGTPDLGFGIGGASVTDLGGYRSGDAGTSLAIQEDGAIVVAGTFSPDGATHDFALARFEPDGAFDSSFGDAGTVVSDLGGDDYARSVAIQDDGAVVVAGYSASAAGDALALARYDSSGALDPAFGDAGIVLTDIGGFEYGAGVRIEDSGRIVVGGKAWNALTGSDFVLAGYGLDGTLDASFGDGGVAITDLGANESGAGLALTAGGNVVVAGSSYAGTDSNFALVRYLGGTDGDADGDGVADAIDVGDGAFDDGAGTSGTIVTTSGLTVLVAPAGDPPGGVRVTVEPGVGFVRLLVCDGMKVKLAPGDHRQVVTITCGSVRIRVEQGGGETSVLVANEEIAVVFPEGADGKVSTAGDAFHVENLGSVALLVTRDGTQSAVPPGGSATVDATPPAITPVVAGTLGNYGWYTSDVTVAWTVADPETLVSSASGCGAVTIAADVGSITLTCQATSGGGTSTRSVTLKRDATAPVVTYGSHPASYTVDKLVSIGCSATDPPPSSGLASSTCLDVSGPAYSFGLGSHTRSASATDNAGNTGSGQTSFSVTVTPASLCNLTARFVHGSAAYQSLSARQRVAVDALTAVACQAVAQLDPRLKPKQRQKLLAAYTAAVDGLVRAGWLTPAQGQLLQGFAAAL
jgi:uncharacterized delta-60 repeat protein